MNIVHKGGETVPKKIENVQEKILIESKKILLNKGYSNLNIREICSNCTIALGTFYNYFSNKDELLFRILREDWSKTIKLANSLKCSDEPFKFKLHKIYMSMQQFTKDFFPIFNELVETKSYTGRSTHNFSELTLVIEELLQIEIQNHNIAIPISIDKYAEFILSNLIYLCKKQYISLDELFLILNI